MVSISIINGTYISPNKKRTPTSFVHNSDGTYHTHDGSERRNQLIKKNQNGKLFFDKSISKHVPASEMTSIKLNEDKTKIILMLIRTTGIKQILEFDYNRQNKLFIIKLLVNLNIDDNLMNSFFIGN